ncbi:MAG: hypothetical protein GXO16_03095 [Epsilonproteobacteria bacterium]|nr:hypothetical protein [Campylobacterota bacterium]
MEYFRSKGVLFRELRSLDLRSFGIKKRWSVYVGVDEKMRYWLIVQIQRKSRFLQKDARELLSVEEELKERLDHGFKKRALLLRGPLCSKARKVLEEQGWSVDAAV